VDLGLLAGLGLGPTPAAAPVGGLLAAVAVGRWGAQLDAGLEGVRTGVLEPASAWSTRQWLSLSGRLEFGPAESLRLDLALGVRGWRIEAGVTGLDAPRRATLLAWGGVASAGAAWRVAGPLAVQARVFGALRAQTERFVVDGLGPVLELAPWEAGLGLGLVVRLGGP
jgi:hypothetical protein